MKYAYFILKLKLKKIFHIKEFLSRRNIIARGKIRFMVILGRRTMESDPDCKG